MTDQDRSLLPSSTKTIWYEKAFASITRSIQATSSGKDSSSLYRGMTTEISIFGYLLNSYQKVYISVVIHLTDEDESLPELFALINLVMDAKCMSRLRL